MPSALNRAYSSVCHESVYLMRIGVAALKLFEVTTI
jgi:hypothetical protein